MTKNKCSNCKVTIERWDVGATIVSLIVLVLSIYGIIFNFANIEVDNTTRTITGIINIFDIFVYCCIIIILYCWGINERFWTWYEEVYVKND